MFKIKNLSYSQHSYPLSRTLVIVLLLAYSSVIVLHSGALPFWTFGFCIGVMAWRIAILRERWRPPGLLVQVLATIAVIFALWLEYSVWFALEPMVTLLVLALSFKLLEIRSQRDYLLILFLSLLVSGCSFLFDQSVLQTALGLLSVLLIVSALVSLYSPLPSQYSSNSTGIKSAENKDDTYQYHPYSIKRVVDSLLPMGRLSAVMLIKSIALMVLLMLIMPRINPLWSLPAQSGTGTTGISDSMSPGDISQLINSNEIALRITPAADSSAAALRVLRDRSQLYWRGLVFDHFDGRQWQRSEPVNRTVFLERSSTKGNSTTVDNSNTVVLNYEVLLEGSGQHWLFTLPNSTVQYISSSVIYTPQQELFQVDAVHNRIKYQVESSVNLSGIGQLHSSSSAHLSAQERSVYTYLPRGSNPKTREQAQLWRQQSKDNIDYIQRVLAFYRSSFVYTLQPPKLGQHAADEFLFTSQQGFCEHYSSSFAVLMRSVGIPARVVVGYQGGEWDDDNSHITVRQRDAHAWNEVWLEREDGTGYWQRVDPTAAVAAIRLQDGVEAALPDADRVQLANIYDNFTWLAQLGARWQIIDYRWQSWVTGYDEKQQKGLLSEYLGEITPLKMALVVLIPLAFIMLLLNAQQLRVWLMPKPIHIKYHRRLEKKLTKLDVELVAGDTIASYCQRAIEKHPDLTAVLSDVRLAFEHLLYAPTTGRDDSQRSLASKALLKKLDGALSRLP